jgi:glycosyltransferase involved in cell wall biosynthesis
VRFPLQTALRTDREAEPRQDSRPAGQRILLIAYHFPPSAAVGGQRIVNFGSRLRLLGWEPQVLTIPDGSVERIDKGRLSDVAGLPVQKAAVWPTAMSLITALNNLRRRGSSPAASAMPVPPGGSGGPKGSESLARRLRRYVFSFLLLPDSEKGWCVPAIASAVRTIRREQIDWFMTSCPPYSVHLIGLAVRRLTGAKWVADFRDPWMTTGSKRLYPTSAMSIGIESWLERRVIENADLVVFNVDRLRNAYRNRYSNVSPDKFVYIPNGLPSQKVTVRSEPEKYTQFTISYTGSLYVGRSPEPLFHAVSRLIQSGAVAADAIRIKLVGQCRYIDGQTTETVVRKHRLESVVEVHDPVPHSEAVDIIRRSHLALLLAPSLPYQVPAKIYDYLAAGTRILAIAEDGGTSDLLAETGAGSAFAGDEVDGIADFILGEIGGDPSSRRPVSLGRLDVQRLTEQLVGHLERVSGC